MTGAVLGNALHRNGGRRIVLAGAGHAQLYSLKRAAEFTRRGHGLFVVAPDMFWYSGLATGMLGGDYPAELDRVDVEALTLKAGGRFIKDKITNISMTRRLVTLESGDTVSYDALSLTLGSTPPDLPGMEGRPGCYGVKPIRQLYRLRRRIEERLAQPGAAPLRLVVAGGGVTAVELAANVDALARRQNGRMAITIIGGSNPLRQVPRGAADLLLSLLQKRGIEVRTGTRVARVETGSAVLETGEAVGFDLFVNATGLKPNPVLASSGLPVDGRGALLVDETLRCIADPNVLAAGDCIAPEGAEIAKIGVHAIREAPILYRNLLAGLDGTPLDSYQPQRTWLWIMNLGDGTGLAIRGSLWWHGRLAWLLKDRIDRRFLREYQAAVGDRPLA